MDNKRKDAATDCTHRTGLDGENTKARARIRWQSKIRKVICCINIAETSLAIDLVRFILDDGKAKKISSDYALRAPALVEEQISCASSTQRRGRAGRKALDGANSYIRRRRAPR